MAVVTSWHECPEGRKVVQGCQCGDLGRAGAGAETLRSRRTCFLLLPLDITRMESTLQPCSLGHSSVLLVGSGHHKSWEKQPLPGFTLGETRGFLGQACIGAAVLPITLSLQSYWWRGPQGSWVLYFAGTQRHSLFVYCCCFGFNLGGKVGVHSSRTVFGCH